MATLVSKLPARHAFQTDDKNLLPIARKVLAGERLNFDDGVALYRSGDILAVGWLANHVREQINGNTAYFNVNRHINPTNVCVASCRLCAFGRKKDAPGTYTMALEEAWETAASGYTEAVTEFHIVGGLHPELPFEYFMDLVRGLKVRFPQVHIKAFTMVEVAFLAKRGKMTIAETLQAMKDAGVDSLPGGGAEIFADRVRHIICDHKIDGGEWLDTARTAHQVFKIFQRQIRMQAADNVKLCHGFRQALSSGGEGFFQRHGVGAGRVFLAAKRAQPARGHAHVGRIDVPVHVEVRDIAVHLFADIVGQPAYA